MKKLKIFKQFSFVFIFLLIGICFLGNVALASVTNGTIDSVNKYAWSENAAWLNFACTNCNVRVTDTVLTGYVWSENHGWIYLAPSNAGVVNDVEGNLSGYAWGESLGWIDFTGVTIDSDGYFNGYANGTISGQINFNCANNNSCASSDFKLQTDWRPQSSRGVVGTAPLLPSLSFGSGSLDYYIGIDESKSGIVIDDIGKNFLLYINSELNFSLASTLANYQAKIIDLDTILGKIKIQLGNDLFLDLNIGDIGEFDLDKDSIPDIQIKYNELKVNRIDLTFKEISIKFVYEEGRLLKEVGNPSVYLIEDGQKRPILNEEIFLKNGFSWADIVESEDLSDYPLGDVLASSLIGFRKEKKLSPSSFTYSFERSLDIGNKGEDVKKLQEFLNNNDFKITENGPGSPGNETEFFGNLTKEALIRFQNNYREEVLAPVNLTVGTGFFGPSTMKFVNSFSGEKVVEKEEEELEEEIRDDETIPAEFLYDLEKEMQNDDVERLQSLLASLSEIYPEGIISGYFGELTEKAVQRFQLKYGVVNSEDDIGFGYFGPKTRAKILEIFD